MAQMIYNGVTLPAVNIMRFEQRALEDDSHTDWYCTEFDFTVNSIINSSYIRVTSGGSVLTNPADIMTTLRSLLLARRKPLSLKFNGVELIPKAPLGNRGTVDAQNGPKPVTCQLIQLTDTTFLMNYHMRASYWENNTVAPGATRINRRSSPVLYNRWSETVDIDGLNLTRRTRQGKFVIRSDNSQGFIADEVRTQMAVVSIPPNFLRESASYTVDPSGLAMQYRVTDQEVYKMPPSPAFKAEGEYTETAPGYGGPRRHGRVRVKLYGDRSANSQARLAEAALTIAMSKLRQNISVSNFPELIFTDASMRLGMYENWVEVSLACEYAIDKKAVRPAFATGGAQSSRVAAFFGNGLINIPFERLPGIGAGLTYTPLTDDAFAKGYTPGYLERGSAGLLIQAAAYFDPSITLDKNILVPQTTGEGSAISTPTRTDLTLIPVLNTVGGSQMNFGLQPGQAGQKQES